MSELKFRDSSYARPEGERAAESYFLTKLMLGLILGIVLAIALLRSIDTIIDEAPHVRRNAIEKIESLISAATD